jgi:hypothetical protein
MGVDICEQGREDSELLCELHLKVLERKFVREEFVRTGSRKRLKIEDKRQTIQLQARGLEGEVKITEKTRVNDAGCSSNVVLPSVFIHHDSIEGPR